VSSLLWKPLLSATVPIDPATEDFDWSCIPFSVYASFKYDGFRSMVQRGVLVSRNGLPVKNRELQKRYGRKEYEGLDVELTDGPANAPDVFHRTSSVVKKVDADASSVVANVIDYTASKNAMPFSLKQRVSVLSANFGPARCPQGFTLIEQVPIENVAQLKKFEAKALAAGWEGIMLRRMDQGAYPQKPGKSNRSTLNEFYLARLKRFEHADAIIVAFHPLEHNLNEERTATGARSSKKAGMVVDADRVGSVTLRDVVTGTEFDTTVGAIRLREWKGWASAIGKTVRYKYQKIGTVDRPRINTCGFDELL
jgi:DNA ligase 1